MSSIIPLLPKTGLLPLKMEEPFLPLPPEELTEKESLSSLPEELLEIIFSFLSIKEVAVTGLTCKRIHLISLNYARITLEKKIKILALKILAPQPVNSIESLCSKMQVLRLNSPLDSKIYTKGCLINILLQKIASASSQKEIIDCFTEIQNHLLALDIPYRLKFPLTIFSTRKPTEIVAILGSFLSFSIALGYAEKEENLTLKEILYLTISAHYLKRYQLKKDKRDLQMARELLNKTSEDSTARRNIERLLILEKGID